MLTIALRSLHRLAIALGLGLLVTPLAAPSREAKAASLARVRSLYINYDLHPPAEALLRHDLSILDAHAIADLRPAQQAGHQVLAYLSLVELAPDSPFTALAKKRGVPHVGRNEAWSSALLDVSTTAWRRFILDDCARLAMMRGFDGFFLDTADSIERLPVKNAAQARVYQEAVISVVKALHERWPQKPIVMNRGFALVNELASSLSGVLVESVCHSFNPITKHYAPVSGSDHAWITDRLREVQALDLPVFAVDYVQPKDKTLARDTAQALRKLGCVPFITTPELTGVVLGTD